MDHKKKDFRKLYEDLVKSDWFKKAYHDKSLGECPFEIPELAESEDERIRKAIIHYILYETKGTISEATEHTWVKWLEKQKEQKSAEWDELQAEFRSINEAFEDGKKEVVDNPERYGLCKSAEWGEDEEFGKILNLVYKAIRKVLASFGVYSEDEELLDSREESIDYYSQRCAEEILKSLRPSWKPSEVCYGAKGHPDPAGTSDLEEAAKEYASKTLCDPDDGPSTGLAKESFIAGAEWQKEQKPAE